MLVPTAVAGAFVGLAYVVLVLAPDWFAETRGLDANGRADARQSVRTAALTLLAGAVAVIGAIYTARTFALNRAGQLTDRFTRAIEQLGREQLAVRLGGIYALERIARDSKDDQPQVVEVLAAYVREHAPRDASIVRTPAPDRAARASTAAPTTPNGCTVAGTANAGPERPATDVQAALTVLARRPLEHEQTGTPAIDMAGTHLAGARFGAAVLVGADLSGANLGGADFDGASLMGVDLAKTDLRRANLTEADLVGANLVLADLSAAVLVRANLAGAVLTGAVLDAANLRGADLSGAVLVDSQLRALLGEANLEGANLAGADLAGADLRDAQYDKSTTVWPDGFDPVRAGAQPKGTRWRRSR